MFRELKFCDDSMLVVQSCLTLCDPMDCSLPGSSVHWILPMENTGVGRHSLLQGIFPTQGLNSGILHCRILSEPPGKPKNTGMGSLSLLQGILLIQELDQDLLHCSGHLPAELPGKTIFYHRATHIIDVLFESYNVT